MFTRDYRGNMIKRLYTFDLNSIVQSQPLRTQLLGTFKYSLFIFWDSDSNYYGWMDNNTRQSTQDLLQKKKHRISLSALFSKLPTTSSALDFDNWRKDTSRACQRGSLADYFGVPPGFMNWESQLPDTVVELNHEIDITPWLTYLNIFRNYFANDQEETFPFLSDKEVNAATNQLEPVWHWDKLSYLDDLMMLIRMQKDGVNLGDESFLESLNEDQYVAIDFFARFIGASSLTVSGGLLCNTYLPDRFVNLLQKVANVSSKVTVTDGSFTIDTLRFQNKLQRLIDRFDVSGGRFSNWLRTVWGVKTRKDMDIPELIGVSSTILNPNVVTSMATTGTGEDTTSATLGEFAGNFNRRDSYSPHSFVASTPGRLMVIASLVPMVDYCQNFDSDLLKVNFADDYKPQFAQLGFQDVPLSDYMALPSFQMGQYVPMPQSAQVGAGGFVDHYGDPMDTVVGKNVAWIDLMTDVNRVHGEFSTYGTMETLVLQRRFIDYYPAAKDPEDPSKYKYSGFAAITQYIQPEKFDYPFVVQGMEHPNWIMQVGFNIQAIRPIGKRFMPNLE